MAFKAFLIRTAFCCVTVCCPVPCGRGLQTLIAFPTFVPSSLLSPQHLSAITRVSLLTQTNTCSWFSHHLSQHTVAAISTCSSPHGAAYFTCASFSWLPASSSCLPVSLNFSPKALKLFSDSFCAAPAVVTSVTETKRCESEPRQ